MLAGTALSLSQISEQFDMSRQGVTKHVKLLEDAGLVQIKSQGRERFCEPDPTPLEKIRDWIGVYDRYWDSQLGKLNQYLDAKRKGN
jgi:biotin operon repressor